MADPLEILGARVRDELDRTGHPRQPWLERRIGPNGEPALDVLIVGAGQSGIAIASSLLRQASTNASGSRSNASRRLITSTREALSVGVRTSTERPKRSSNCGRNSPSSGLPLPISTKRAA